MKRTSPAFRSLGLPVDVSDAHECLSLSYENGFLHLRNLGKDCFQVQISREGEADFFSRTLLNPASGKPQFEKNGNGLRTGPDADFHFDPATNGWYWEKEGRTLLRTEPGLGFGFLGEETIACLHLEEWQNFYGLGEKTGPLNRRSHAYTNWNTDAFAYGDGRDPLYTSFPFYLAVKDGIWYGVLADNTAKTRFNFGASNRRMVQISVATGPLNLIFIPGPSPGEVLQRYHQLTGFMPMPPRWALGLQQCRYSYYPEHEVREVARQYRSRNIPCDVLYLDIHYMDAYKVFTVDKNRFPDLKKLCDDVGRDGFRVVPIQDPGIRAEAGYEPYDKGLEKNVFVRYPDGQPWVAGVWPGDCVFPDFTSPDVRQWWSEKTADWVKETGVSGLWNDMNEPATWGQDVPDLLEFDMEGRGSSHREAHNVYGMGMAEASRRGLQLARPGERPFVLSRAGFAGAHRSCAIWSGDNVANEEHFFLGIRLMLGMAMSGVSFSGPDVGGFVGDAGRDLFVRWVSVASFFPFFRLHSMIDSRDNEPWSYGELAEAIAGNYIRLRYKLLPVLYSAFFESSVSGYPVVMPAFTEIPGNPFHQEFQHQFLLAKDILVIPASHVQQAVQAELPPGNWYGLTDGILYHGNQVRWISAWLDQLPVLIREGAILVTRDPGTCTDDSGSLPFRDVHVFYKGSGQSSFQLYEDDGTSENPLPENRAIISIQFFHEAPALKLERTSGEKAIAFRHLYLWHFPEGSHIEVQGDWKAARPASWQWLEPLPNFDPFEDRGKSYFSACQCISLQGILN